MKTNKTKSIQKTKQNNVRQQNDRSMTKAEVERRAQKRKKRRRKKQIRTVVIGLLILILLAVSVFFIYRLISGNANDPEAKLNEIKSRAETQVTAYREELKRKQEEIRKKFAVDPNLPCGSEDPSEEMTVYLTFDDGPSENTAKVLDILDRYDVKATFFVTAINPDYSDMIKTAYDKGHTIGLHTYSHNYASVYASEAAYFEDLDRIGQLVKDQIGYVPCFIRFPGGSSNGVSAKYCSGIMTRLSQAVRERGYQYYDWNATSGDGGTETNPDVLAANAVGCDRVNIIILCHDSAPKGSTVEALPQIIETYLNRGYVFKPLDRNSFYSHHGIAN